MKSLDRMLVADVLRMWRQGLAISILLACGIAVFVMSSTTVKSLEISRAKYYRDGNFADLFVHLVRAPNHIAGRIAAIDGVQRVQPRIVRRVLLNIPEMIEPASCQLVSMENQPTESVNRVFLRSGRFPNDDDRTEVVVSELFAEAHGFRPGDHLDAIIGERYQRLNIVGIGLSAEFVYVVQPGVFVTDDRRSGVLWMPLRQMEAAYNMEGAFNDLAIQLRPNASRPEIIQRVDELTKAYGGTGAYDREDQASHRRVADELQQMQTMTYVMPTIFLAVSAFLFNIVFSRLVQQQKEQIATLRAFGYFPHEIAVHYIKMVAILVGVGAVLGLGGGIWLSDWMLTQYARFFRFPVIISQFAFGSAMSAIAIGLVAALVGTQSAIRSASKLVPAEAMRPEAPREYRGLWTERLRLSRFASPVTRMILRRLETNQRATILSVLGMSLGLSVLVLGTFMEDTVDFVIEVEFEKSQRHDAMLTFMETRSASAIDDAKHLPGVTAVEAFRSVPVRMHFGRKNYRLGVMGLESNPKLFRVLDDQQRPIEVLEGSGLTISEKLAEILGVKLGDVIELEILEGDRPFRQATVDAIFPNFTDPSAYLNRHELARLLRESEQVSGVFLAVEPSLIPQMYAAVKETPAVVGVMDKRAAMHHFRDMVSESTSVMRTVNALFAMAIAFGVIYNCAMIILSERSRDLATLRVMGFTRGEASRVLLGEIATITLLSIPIGLVIGYGFAYLTSLLLDTETQRFPLAIARSTYAYSTLVIFIAAALSGWYVRRMVNDLDLISVLKVKE